MTQNTRPNDAGFPIPEDGVEEYGLTKREYFAALAMQGILSGCDVEYCESDSQQIALAAVMNADALIKTLND